MLFLFILFFFNLFRQKPLNKSIFTDQIQQKPINNKYILGYMEYDIKNESYKNIENLIYLYK